MLLKHLLWGARQRRKRRETSTKVKALLEGGSRTTRKVYRRGIERANKQKSRESERNRSSSDIIYCITVTRPLFVLSSALGRTI